MQRLLNAQLDCGYLLAGGVSRIGLQGCVVSRCLADPLHTDMLSPCWHAASMAAQLRDQYVGKRQNCLKTEMGAAWQTQWNSTWETLYFSKVLQQHSAVRHNQADREGCYSGLLLTFSDRRNMLRLCHSCIILHVRALCNAHP